MNKNMKEQIQNLVYQAKNNGKTCCYSCDSQEKLEAAINLVQITLAKSNTDYTHPRCSDWGIDHPTGMDAIIGSSFMLENGGHVFLANKEQKEHNWKIVKRC